jgi:hypothetical protein
MIFIIYTVIPLDYAPPPGRLSSYTGNINAFKKNPEKTKIQRVLPRNTRILKLHQEMNFLRFFRKNEKKFLENIENN